MESGSHLGASDDYRSQCHSKPSAHSSGSSPFRLLSGVFARWQAPELLNGSTLRALFGSAGPVQIIEP